MATSAGGRKSAPLPYEAALGACVSFAAQVLGSAVPASHVCTKDALGAIVREAHRFGLHAARLWGATDTASSASTDPRKLLKRLQAQAPEGGGSSSPSRLEPLESLAFKDLTWDAHGDADQTLEMELLELETRATEADASVCILLTLHASPADAPASPEAAILWLPASDGRRGDQKKQYLLYVCPGRVKVVKSVAELLKKLRDEIRLMDGRGVGYRVWTLARGPRRHKKKAPPDQATETEKSSPRLSARATESAAQQRRKVDIRPLAEDVRVLPMSVFSFASAPRTAANREETVAVSTPTEMNPSLDEPTALAEGLEPSESSFVEKPLASQSATLRKRLAVSLSCSSGVPRTRTQATAWSEAMWASADSDLRWPRLRSADARQEGSEAHGCRGALDPVHSDEHPSALPSDSETTASLRAAPQQPEPKILEASARVASEGAASIFLFSRDASDGGESESGPRDDASRGRTFASERQSQQMAFESCGQSSSEEPSDRRSDHRAVDTANDAPSEDVGSVVSAHDCQAVPARASVPVRKNYRAKLGNRVWWELRCTAERLQQQHAAESAARPPPRSRREPTQPQPIDLHTSESMEREPPLPTAAHSPGTRLNCPLPAVRGEVKTPVGSNGGPQNSLAKVSNLARHPERGRHHVEQAENQCATSRSEVSSCSSDMAAREALAPAFNWPVEGAQSRGLQPKSTSSSAISVVAYDVSELGLRSRHDLGDFGTSGVSEDALLSSTTRPREPSPSTRRSVVATERFAMFDVENSATKDHSAFCRCTSGGHVKSSSASSPAKVGALDPDEEEEEEEEDDVKLIRSEWTSTRTSYEVEREQQHQQPQSDPEHLGLSAETRAAVVFGGVTMRSRRSEPSTMAQRPEVEDDSSSTGEDADSAAPTLKRAGRHLQAVARTGTSPDTRHDSPFARQNGYDSATPAVDTRAAQHVATFITVATEAIGKRGNQSVHAEKLAELRRKKLQQLHHRAREEQLLQQQKKQAQPQPTKSIVSNNGTDAGAGGGAPLSKPAVGKRPSNKKLVQNALEYTLLAGGSMEKDRRAALAALARSPCDNFIVLLKSARDLKFRALYEHHADREEVSRLFAAAPSCPPLLTCGAIGQFFKYNSGKKEFVAIDSRSFTVKTDACALKDALVFKKKAGIGRLL